MDKYAVVLDDEKAKTAASGKKCPQCGGDLPGGSNKDGSVSPPNYCPNCGTEPFEARPKGPSEDKK